MYTMQVIEVNGIRLDSYTANGHHLHRSARLDGSWQVHKRNWLGQLRCIQDGMDWPTARDLFNWHTNEYINDNW